MIMVNTGMTLSDLDLSRTLSHALRHEPWVYELELDAEGWTSLESLLESFRSLGPQWAGLDEARIADMIAASEKKRHEIRAGLIRAFYGHSVPQTLSRIAAAPPQVLFHGTTAEAAMAISVTGLLPMKRQHVHLSLDRETATKVGMRKTREPVIIEVDAVSAHASGVDFFHGNENVWLSDVIPVQFLKMPG